MSLAQKILNNFVILLTSQTIVRLMNYVTIIYLVRVIAPSDFGLLNFAKTLALYFGLILNIGLDQVGLRELSKDRDDKNNLMGTILSIKVLLAIVAYTALVLFVLSSRHIEHDIKRMVLLYGFIILAEGVSMVWIFNAFEKMKDILYSEMFGTGLLLILVVTFVRGPADIFKVPVFEAISVLTGCLVLISRFYITGRRFSFSVNFRFARDLIFRAIPLGGVSVTTYIYYSFGVTLLGFVKGMKAVGIYMAPYKLVLILTQAILGTLGMVIIPTIARLYMESKEELIRFLSKLSRMLLFFSFFIFILCTLSAEPIITTIYGSKYLESVWVFRILLWWVVAIYMNFHLTLTLYACGKTKEFFTVSFYALLINVILSIFLIPRFDMFGLAIAMVLSAGGALLLALSFVNKNVVKLPIGKAEAVFLIGSITIPFLFLTFRFSFIYKTIFAITVYLLFSFFMKILKRDDLIYLKSLSLVGRNG